MAAPLVTVLMTVYNGGEYLRSSVHSVLNQTYKDFEFLIVNDCSTDNSLDIIKSFNDKRIIIHHNEKNMGQTKSLNVGLRLAKGKYVARMDADDMAFPLWIEKTLNYILKNPEYAAVSSYAVLIDSFGNPYKIFKTPNNFQEIIINIFFAKVINHVGAIINKEVIMEIGGYNEKFMASQDFELWSSLIKAGYKIVSIPEVLVSIRIHENSFGFITESKKGPSEVAEIIARTVNKLTNLTLSYDDAIKLRLFYRFPHQMTISEFKWAHFMYKEIFDNLKAIYKLNPRLLKTILKKPMLGAFCKRALYEIENNKPNAARSVIYDYNRYYGCHIMTSMILLLSFFGNGLIKRILYIYTKCEEKYTKIRYLSTSKKNGVKS